MATCDANVTKDLMKGAGELIQSPRLATAVSGSTLAAWLGDVFDKVSWGDVAGCIGALLSLVLIVIHVWNFPLNRRRIRLQVELLEENAAAKRSEG